MSDILRSQRIEDVEVWALNRPQSRNALTHGLIVQLDEAVRAAIADADVGAMVITGAPPAFCGGFDLREVAEHQGDAEKSRAMADALFDLFEHVYNAPKPMVAAVNGHAVAGGAGLMSTCDYVVASRKARIGYPEIKRGIVAAVVMPYLARQVGERMAKQLLLTGELLDAYEARNAGLINEVRQEDSVLLRAVEVAQKLAAMPRSSYAETKRVLHEVYALDEAAGRESVKKVHSQVFLSDEAKESIARFLAGENS